MATVQRKFGPTDHGRPVTAEERDAAEYDGGFRYEVIDGRLYVSPMPNVPENYLERWLRRRLEAYSDANPAVLNYVTPKGRVTVPGRPDLTEPEPDVAAYRDFPDDPIADGTAWDDVHPLIVAEVLVGNDPHKDLVRNVELYFQVPAIQEYWVLDGRDGDGKPSLLAHRRAADGWQVEVVPFGATYTTPTLPGFTLVIDPRA